jgi:hypothetical protein
MKQPDNLRYNRKKFSVEYRKSGIVGIFKARRIMG